MDRANIRETIDDKLAGIVRLLLALLFVMTGAMKLLVPIVPLLFLRTTEGMQES